MHESMKFRCEECAGEFAGLDGGICGGCGRMLCGAHLHGLLGQFMRPWAWGERRCRRCRQGEASNAPNGASPSLPAEE